MLNTYVRNWVLFMNDEFICYCLKSWCFFCANGQDRKSGVVLVWSITGKCSVTRSHRRKLVIRAHVVHGIEWHKRTYILSYLRIAITKHFRSFVYNKTTCKIRVTIHATKYVFTLLPYSAAIQCTRQLIVYIHWIMSRDWNLAHFSIPLNCAGCFIILRVITRDL